MLLYVLFIQFYVNFMLVTEGVYAHHSGRFAHFAIADIAAVYITHASEPGLFRLNIEKWLDKVVSHAGSRVTKEILRCA